MTAALAALLVLCALLCVGVFVGRWCVEVWA